MSSILLTGASGNVGRVVARELGRDGIALRLATRSGVAPDGADVETLRFDFTDSSTWPAAFRGVHAMLLVRPPALGNVRRDLLPAMASACAAGVRHVVFLSVQGADRLPVPHRAVETWLRGSGMSWTFLRPSFFHQNLSGVLAADIRDRDELAVPAGGGATAFVDTEDVGAVAAAALRDPDRHADRAWTLTGPRAVDYAEVADLLSAELARPIRYTRPGIWRYARHARVQLQLPPAMVAVTTAIFTTARLGRAAGLSDDVRSVLGRDPIDLRQFLHRERDTWLPSPTGSP